MNSPRLGGEFFKVGELIIDDCLWFGCLPRSFLKWKSCKRVSNLNFWAFACWLSGKFRVIAEKISLSNLQTPLFSGPMLNDRHIFKHVSIIYIYIVEFFISIENNGRNRTEFFQETCFLPPLFLLGVCKIRTRQLELYSSNGWWPH